MTGAPKEAPITVHLSIGLDTSCVHYDREGNREFYIVQRSDNLSFSKLIRNC
jgi:hypothetical protein